MWRIPAPLIAGGSETIASITLDTYIGNLWVYLGSPVGPREVVLVVDGADAGDIQITADWTAGSTFQINCINGGRVVGLGGNGGDGGNDNGATGTPGSAGGSGGPALSSNGFTVNIDIDDGYLLGGGGGGGGAAYDDTGAGGDAGGGGGGGAGFAVTTGGSAGVNIGSPPGTDGTDGGPTGAGVGGAGAGSGLNIGGNGGEFGLGGYTGDADTSISAYYGGHGGRAGSAFLPTNSATIVYNGVKTEATLISEMRLLGQTTEGYAQLEQIIYNNGGFGGGVQTVGWTFSSVGLLTFNSSATPDTNYSNNWYGGPFGAVATGADFEVRTVSGHFFGTAWSVEAAAIDTWIALGSDRVWSITGSGTTDTRSLYEIRSVGSSGILASGYLHATIV
jgi:hypothetical protein